MLSEKRSVPAGLDSAHQTPMAILEKGTKFCQKNAAFQRVWTRCIGPLWRSSKKEQNFTSKKALFPGSRRAAALPNPGQNREKRAPRRTRRYRKKFISKIIFLYFYPRMFCTCSARRSLSGLSFVRLPRRLWFFGGWLFARDRLVFGEVP